MTIPRIAGLLVALAVAPGANALQLGQVSGQSNRGETLAARITLYGADADDAEVTLLPAFGAAGETLLARGVSAALRRGADGAPYVALTSNAPLNDAEISFRLRVGRPGLSLVRAYVLPLPEAPAPLPVARRPAPRPSRPTVPRALEALPTRGNYGPVRGGQSLWGILAERGLAGGDLAATLRQVVAMNPAAFVNGDPSRLRVGAMLTLPAETAAAPSAASVPPPATDHAQDIDEETAARLQRLAARYAEIRARYLEQQAAAAPHDETQAQRVAPAAPPRSDQRGDVAPSTAPKAATPAPIQGAAPAAPRAAPPNLNLPPEPETTPLWRSPLLLALGGLLGVALLFAIRRFLAARRQTTQGALGARSAESEKVAEIALKAGKRVQLEDEVRRMITGRRDTQTASPTYSPVDLPRGSRESMDDIETCIAHGHYDEAEVMLEQVIAEAPENFRAKLRLAEIYYLNERPDEFADLAEEIHQQHRRDIGDESWQRLIRMGKVIAPERPPFSGPVAVEASRRA